MSNSFETILENILEAKDKGTSLATLLEQNPEKKGEYSDAWKFIEALDEHMYHGITPNKERFRSFVESLPNSKSILSPWMPYITFLAPALVIVFVVFSYSSRQTPSDVAVITTQQETAPALFDSQTQMSTLNESETAPMAKNSKVASLSSQDPIDESFNSVQDAYAQDSQAQSESAITFSNANNYNDLSALYE